MNLTKIAPKMTFLAKNKENPKYEMQFFCYFVERNELLYNNQYKVSFIFFKNNEFM